VGLLLPLLACGVPVEEAEILLSEPPPAALCQLSSTDTAIDFGAVEVTEPATFTLEFENIGQETCLIQSLSFIQSASAFKVAALSDPSLDPGQSLSVELAYSPPHRGVDRAVLVMLSNDAQTPDRRLPVQGQGVAQQLSLSLQPQSVQETAVGCDGTQTLTLANTGEKPLVVEAVTLGGEGESFQWSADALALAYPLTLEPLQAQSMDFVFQPQVDGLVGGHLSVHSNDPLDPVYIEPLTGRGVVMKQVTDRFEQDLHPKTDVVFSFDWSGPINIYWKFAAEFQWMTATLDAAKVDYHIIALLGDDGCPGGGNGPVTRLQSVDEQTALFAEQSCADSPRCPWVGGNQERAFMMLEAAFTAENTEEGGCNEGVFREDAELHLISFSDEPEQSYERWWVYVDRLQALKKEPEDVTFHGVGGDQPLGCEGFRPYYLYYQAIVATGGEYRSICGTDYIGHMQALGAAVTPERYAFPLSEQPMLETLKVEVDGVWQERGWSYDAEENQVLFEENWEPRNGAEFAFHYVEQEDCES
jgi:hypothetical protein